MASAEVIEDDRNRKRKPKPKIKTNLLGVANVAPVWKKSTKSERPVPAPRNRINVADSTNASEFTTTHTAESGSPAAAGLRRPSQPLLTIAEEEETAVDPARRGSTQGSQDDEDDERSTGDTMDMFEDVRRRRNGRAINDEEPDKTEMMGQSEADDDDHVSLAFIDDVDDEDDEHVVDIEKEPGGYGGMRPVAKARQNGEVKPGGEEDGKSITATSQSSRLRNITTVKQTDDEQGVRAAGAIIDVGSERKAAWFAAMVRADVAAVVELMSRQRGIVNCVDENGRTALHVAVENRRPGMVDLLLKAGALVDAKSSGGETPLHVATRLLDRTVASRLLSAGADPNTAVHQDGTTPLHLACQHGDGSPLVRLLIRHGARPTADRRSRSGLVSGIAPLHDAADSGDIRSVRALLDVDPSLLVKSVTDRGCTALHVAARHGRSDIIGELISRGGSAGGSGRAGSDKRGAGVLPLHIAAENGRPEAVRMLVDAGADVNASREHCGTRGVTSLHLSVMKGHVDVVRVLLALGASVNISDSDGTTPLHLAARAGLVDVAAALIERGASTNVGMKAQHQGRASIGTNGKVSTPSFNQTPLHLAVRHRYADVTKLLLRTGCDVNAAESIRIDSIQTPGPTSDGTGIGNSADNSSLVVNGYAALHWAVENGDLATVRLLLDAGANPDLGASFDAHSGVTPLHLAAQDGYADIAEELLRRGARRNPRKRTKNRDNVTPLHQAAYNGHPATVAVLVRAGCDVNVQADNGYAAIHYAAQRGSVEITEAILAAGGSKQKSADIGLLASVKDQLNITPLHLAVQSGSVDVIRALINAGAPVDAGKRTDGGISGVTALHQAVYQLQDDVVAALLEHGADPTRSMEGWYTPLHVAAEKSSVSIATCLIQAGAVVNARASIGHHVELTPLHVAAQHGHTPVVRLLVQAGADLVAVRRFADRSSITALHLAAENGFAETVQTLIELVSAKSRAARKPSTTAANDRPPQLSARAYVNLQDSLGFSALHLAVEYQFADVVRVLLSAGADITSKTANGLSAYKIANRRPSNVIQEMLKSEANQSFSTSTMTGRSASLPIAVRNDKKHGTSGKLKSLLCGVSKS